MRAIAFTIVTVGLLIAADEPKKDAKDDPKNDTKKELKKFEGNWTLASGEQEGMKLTDEMIKDSKLKIAGDKHTVNVGKETFVGTHSLDPTKKPKEIDSTDTEGPAKGKTMLGIYEIKGDEFKVCFAAPDSKERPKEFTTKSGSGYIVHVWKRAKGKVED